MHEQQFCYLEAMLDKLESAKEALEKSVIDVAKKNEQRYRSDQQTNENYQNSR